MIYRRTPMIFKLALLLAGLAGPVHAQEVIGTIQTHVAQSGDTLADLAQQNEVGYDEMIAANPGIDPWLPPEGTEIVLPTQRILPTAPHEGLVINLGEMRLYYFPKGGEVQSYAIGMGRDGFMTPSGSTTIVRKMANPPWYRTASERADKPELPPVIPPGPDNPLGAYALYLGWPAYLIHGTENPRSVGRLASRGCVRLYPDAIETLFKTVPIGTKVTVVDQPVKFATIDGQLYVSVFPSRSQANELEDHNSFTPAVPEGFTKMVLAAAGPDANRLDWDKVRQAANDRKAYPVQITR